MQEQFEGKLIDFLSPVLIVAALLLAVFFTSFITETKVREDKLLLKAVTFSDIPDWDKDSHDKAVEAMLKSCSRMGKKNADNAFGTDGFAGSYKDWQAICAKLSAEDYTNEQAQAFFENNFIPYEVWGKDGREGLFTGYYEPTLQGSYIKSERYNVPIYNHPNNLVKASLGDFHQELKGRSITGRVEGKSFIPYYKRAEIENGALSKTGAEIVWVDNAVDAFFLHIQGSGRVVLDNGEVLRIGYAAQNGHGYTAIGRELIARGALSKENVSMQSIRKWLEENPQEAIEVMNINNSYIFFHKLDLDGEGPLGAEGVSLTPQRSMAVDNKKIPYGVPLWLEAEEPEGEGMIKRLMIAQDTGGAIKGVVRGDFFWGAGEMAAHKAGLMKSKGRTWVLLPKSVTVAKDKLKNRWEIF